MGTIVNTIAIIIGTLAGLIIKKGLSERLKNSLTDAMGVAVLLIGITGTLSASFKIIDRNIESTNTLLLIMSLVIGTIIGELLKLDEKFTAVGNYLGVKFSRGKEGDFVKGFVNAVIIFCVGAMAIVGAIEDGLSGNPSTLYAKSVLDGIMSMILSSAYGFGVIFSSVVVFTYQGIITLCAVYLKQFAAPEIISQTSMVGSALILCIGLNMLNIKKLNVANMLPAAFIPIIYALIKGFLHI